MKEFKGTQGEWNYEKKKSCYILSGNGWGDFCKVYRISGIHKQEFDKISKANVQLISKAPELLAMLQKVLKVNKHHSFNGHLINEQIEKLIREII